MNKRKDVLDKLNIINGFRVKTPAPKRRTAKGLYLNYIYNTQKAPISDWILELCIFKDFLQRS